jgi:hypothetical protein
MKLYTLKVHVVNPNAYKPYDCDIATVTGIFHDDEKQRLCVQLTYANGAIDFIPVSELGKKGFYEIIQPISETMSFV